MQYLETLVRLLSKTDTRDQLLRLVQYATIHSEDHITKGATFNVYNNLRRTRKWLRFLRIIEFLKQIRTDSAKLTKCKQFSFALLKIFSILQSIFRVLFYLFDHHVVLGQLQIISKQNESRFYPKSIKMYLLQNVMGACKSILQILVLIQNGSLSEGSGQEESLKKGEQMIRSKSIQFLRNILDIFVACYYINKPAGLAPRIGFIGIVTSLIGLAQAEKLL